MVKVNVSLNYAVISLSAMLFAWLVMLKGFYGASFQLKKGKKLFAFLLASKII